MLVLSRKVGERLVINDNIVVTVVKVRGDRVQIGIQAPPEVPIQREEITEQVRGHYESRLPAGVN
jgi:carbon storage regulator